MLYVLQENQHILHKNTLQYSDILNAFDFQNIHATNVPDPVNPTDIVNYRTMTTTLDTWFETTAVPILKTYLDKTATDAARAQEQADAAQLQATRSCACAASAEHWYAEINAVLKNVGPNFFNTFFILAGVADGGGGDDFEIITSDGGSASTVLFIDRANDGMSSNPAEWYVVNPTISEALRGRSIISATLQDNGEIIFVTD